MKLLIVLASLVLAINAASDAELWTKFKEEHSKTYKNLVEERVRFGIFQSTLRQIEEHNAKYESGAETYFLKVNQFSDLTDEEFESIYLRYQAPKIQFNSTYDVPEGGVTADAVDWRSKGAVLEVKNQGNCGSCWAFSTTGAIEGQNAIKHGAKVSLSEEQLVDCSTRNAGCNGGDMNLAFAYVKSSGISTEASYPYTASSGRAGKCTTGKDSGVKVTGYVRVASNENALKAAVANNGPISIAINGNGIKSYGGGVFNLKSCPKTLNHGVLAVGYGTKDIDYWIVKNSWGAGWGESGYINMARNQNQQCGIGAENSYPTLA